MNLLPTLESLRPRGPQPRNGMRVHVEPEDRNTVAMQMADGMEQAMLQGRHGFICPGCFMIAILDAMKIVISRNNMKGEKVFGQLAPVMEEMGISYSEGQDPDLGEEEVLREGIH